jgi:hypothetical protein
VHFEPDVIDLLALDMSAVELLDRFQYLAAQVEPALRYLLSRAASRKDAAMADGSPPPHRDDRRREDYIADLAGAIQTGKESLKVRIVDFAHSYPVASEPSRQSDPTLECLGTAVAEEIRKAHDPNILKISAEGPFPKGVLTCYRYQFGSLRNEDGGGFAWAELGIDVRSKKHVGEGQTSTGGVTLEEALALDLYFRGDACVERDRRSLWEAVNVLQDLLGLLHTTGAK